MTDATKPAGDLVQRLRQTFHDIPYHRDQLHIDAAAEIDRLTAALADRERAIAAAVAAEREACADEADHWIGFDKTASDACNDIARAIRARSGAKG